MTSKLAFLYLLFDLAFDLNQDICKYTKYVVYSSVNFYFISIVSVFPPANWCWMDQLFFSSPTMLANLVWAWISPMSMLEKSNLTLNFFPCYVVRLPLLCCTSSIVMFYFFPFEVVFLPMWGCISSYLKLYFFLCEVVFLPMWGCICCSCSDRASQCDTVKAWRPGIRAWSKGLE